MKSSPKWKILCIINCFPYSGVNGLTCQDKQIIVEEHNRLREWVAQGEIEGQPAAENMMEMVNGKK